MSDLAQSIQWQRYCEKQGVNLIMRNGAVTLRAILTASGATQALKLMNTVRPVLVLTGALMPTVDGVAA